MYKEDREYGKEDGVEYTTTTILEKIPRRVKFDGKKRSTT